MARRRVAIVMSMPPERGSFPIISPIGSNRPHGHRLRQSRPAWGAACGACGSEGQDAQHVELSSVGRLLSSDYSPASIRLDPDPDRSMVAGPFPAAHPTWPSPWGSGVSRGRPRKAKRARGPLSGVRSTTTLSFDRQPGKRELTRRRHE